ncbi:unnamed protein product [Penicillium olsonii]|nr:unnamed protein product [Penicillium olsonii]CAG7919789.1 unnamed protein product [Penicillium olsonii]
MARCSAPATMTDAKLDRGHLSPGLIDCLFSNISSPLQVLILAKAMEPSESESEGYSKPRRMDTFTAHRDIRLYKFVVPNLRRADSFCYFESQCTFLRRLLPYKPYKLPLSASSQLCVLNYSSSVTTVRMRFHLAVLLGVVGLSIAAPVTNSTTHKILPDGLPVPSPSELELIEDKARGTLPNGPPPPAISEGGLVNLKLVAFNELFEVAFFHELITNITDKVLGYRFSNEDDYHFVLNGLKAILAQEELHVLDANNALSHFGVEPIEPCQYRFPVQDFDSAILLASTFTDVVLGTLQDVVERFAIGGDFGLSRAVSSIIGQEGEQQGWFRIMQGKVPSELPFLTTSDLNFAFTAIQSFIVPSSCPNIGSIPLETFEPLNIIKSPSARTGNIVVSFFDHLHETTDGILWIVYVNQQNLPIVEPLQVISRENNEVVAEALFPWDAYEMNGLTFAVVTASEGPFPNAYSVAKATIAGLGIFMIN